MAPIMFHKGYRDSGERQRGAGEGCAGARAGPASQHKPLKTGTRSASPRDVSQLSLFPRPMW